MPIFFKNIKTSIDKAREDERIKCNKDKEKALDRLKEELNNNWSLALMEQEAENKSIRLRLNEYESREKEIRKKEQTLRQQAVALNHVMNDLQYFSEQDDKVKLERSQTINRLLEETFKIKKILIEDN